MSSDRTAVPVNAAPAERPRSGTGTGSWHAALRRYLVAIALGRLTWEILHMPLYPIWRERTWREIAFAALHCTGGDILLALSSRSDEHTMNSSHHFPSRIP